MAPPIAQTRTPPAAGGRPPRQGQIDPGLARAVAGLPAGLRAGHRVALSLRGCGREPRVGERIGLWVVTAVDRAAGSVILCQLDAREMPGAAGALSRLALIVGVL